MVSGTRPTAGFPYSSAGYDHGGHDRSSAALPASRFPAPEGFESSAMPPKDRLGLNHLVAPSRLGQNWVIHTSSARSLPRSRRRDGVCLKAMLS